MLATNTILQNRYRIIRQLGQGGMGTVYEAIDERLDTIVALKESHFTDERLRKQFEREARLLAKLRHPSMTRVIDHFTEGDGQFLVMDYIAGEDLCELLKRNDGRFPLDKVLEWADQLLDTMEFLHKQEPPIIHRDIKPQNLKLSNSGQIILLDFGLAKGFAGQISRVTTSGSIFGYTPNYAPLEQIQGTGTDPRSDLYSLAATLYHLLTGVVPPDVLTRLSATSDGQPDPLRPAHQINPHITPNVSDVLIKAMAIGRNQRFAAATEMHKALNDANNCQKAGNNNEAETAILPPPTIVGTPLTERAEEQEDAPLPQNTTDADLIQTPQRMSPTVASPPMSSSAKLPSIDLSKKTSSVTPSHSSASLVLPVRKSKRWIWVMSSIIITLLIIGVIIIFIANYNPRLKRTLYTGKTNLVAFSSDSRNLLTTDGYTVKTWNVETGALSSTISYDYRSFPIPLEKSPDGKIDVMLSGSEIILRDEAYWRTGGHKLVGHSGRVTSIAFSPDGKILASGSEDETVKLWDISELQ